MNAAAAAQGRAVAEPAVTAAGRSFAASPWFRMVRWGLRRSEPLGPQVAGRLAAAVFCAPMQGRLLARTARPAPGVRVGRLPFESASLTVYAWDAPPEAPRVLLTHGWGGWALQMAPLAEALQARGYAPIAVDQPAHGRSAGWRTSLAQFARALDYLAARSGQLHAVIGHSMGGSSALVAAARGLQATRLVTIASPTDLTQVTRDYADAFGLRESTRHAMVQHIEAREAVVLDRMHARWTAPRIAAPVLVVHDQEDRTVPVLEAHRLVDWLPDARLMLTTGLGHRRVLGDRDVIARVVDFIARP